MRGGGGLDEAGERKCHMIQLLVKVQCIQISVNKTL